MLVTIETFHDPSFSPFGAGDNGSPQRKKPFRIGLLVWWDDNLTEWSIEVWVFRGKENAVLIRQNGNPTDHTLMRWKRGRTEDVDELTISKVSAGRYAHETVINITPAHAQIRIEHILKTVAVGEVSDSLPVIL